MKRNAAILAGLFVLAGAWTNVNALQNGKRPPESWVEGLAPTQVGDWKLEPKEPGAKFSYKMDKITYDELDPIGIVAQRMRNGGLVYDAVIIAGNQNESFHDQRWCFQAQGWELEETLVDKVATKNAGEIPVQLVKISRPGQPATIALFTFQGPSKFHATTFEMGRDYFMAGLSSGRLHNGFFFRFIPQFPGATKEEVKEFAADYIDAAFESSGGVLGRPGLSQG
jgi:hypothetical protein